MHDTGKSTIPSPSVLHYRGGRKAISESVYPTMDAFYHDLGQAFGQIAVGFTQHALNLLSGPSLAHGSLPELNQGDYHNSWTIFRGADHVPVET